MALPLVGWAWLEAVGLVGAMRIIHIKGYTSYMIALRKHFDPYKYTFLLLIRDKIVTLEDVHCILWVPLEGELVIVATDRVVINPYVGEGYQTWDLSNGGVFIYPLYHQDHLECREVITMLPILSFILPNSLGPRFPWNMFGIIKRMVLEGMEFY